MDTHDQLTFSPLVVEGGFLIATNPCEMEDESGPALTIGKAYKIEKATDYGFSILDDFDNNRNHWFDFDDIKEFHEINQPGEDYTIFFRMPITGDKL